MTNTNEFEEQPEDIDTDGIQNSTNRPAILQSGDIEMIARNNFNNYSCLKKIFVLFLEVIQFNHSIQPFNCCCRKRSQNYYEEIQRSNLPTVLWSFFTLIPMLFFGLMLVIFRKNDDSIVQVIICMLVYAIILGFYLFSCLLKKIIHLECHNIAIIIGIGSLMIALIAFGFSFRDVLHQSQQTSKKMIPVDTNINPPAVDCYIRRNDILEGKNLFKFNETFLIGPSRSGKTTYLQQLYHDSQYIGQIYHLRKLPQIVIQQPHLKYFVMDNVGSMKELQQARLKISQIKVEINVLFGLTIRTDPQLILFLDNNREKIVFIDYMSQPLLRKYTDCVVKKFDDIRMINALDQLEKLGDFLKINTINYLSQDPIENQFCLNWGKPLMGCQDYNIVNKTLSQNLQAEYGKEFQIELKQFFQLPERTKRDMVELVLYDSKTNVKFIDREAYNFFVYDARVNCEGIEIVEDKQVYELPCHKP